MVRASILSAILASAGASLVVAAPAPAPTAAPKLEERAMSCTFTNAASASKSKTSCSTIVLSNIAVPSGTTLDMTGLTKGTTVIFEGTTTFGFEAWAGPLISVSGTDITVTGASGHVINGNGAKWWDGQGSNGGVTKPKMFYAHNLIDSTIENLNIENTPVQFMSIDGCTNLHVTDVTHNNAAGASLGHNTDAFDVGDSTSVYISGAVVSNQDDCLAINSGTDISFTSGSCTGSHGLSIGSVGGRTDNTVENVYIYNNKVSGGQNGIRIKTVSGATGTVNNVTFSDIILSGITNYGIVFEQDYENGSPTGTPTNGVSLTDVTVKGVTGTVASSATDVYVLCGSGSCSDWSWSESVSGGVRSAKCTNLPSGVSC